MSHRTFRLASVLHLALALGLLLSVACAKKTPAEQLNEAKKLYDDRQVARAVIKLKQLVRENPKDPAAYEARFMLAQYYTGTGDANSAISNLEAVHAALPIADGRAFDALRGVVSLRKQTGDLDGALAIVEKSIAASKPDFDGSGTLRLMKADVLISNKDAAKSAEGAALFREVMLGDPEPGQRGFARENLAGWHRTGGRFDEANKVYADYMEKFPKDEVNNRLVIAQAVNLHMAGRDPEAKALFGPAKDIFEKQATDELDKDKRAALLLELARDHEMMGDLPTARSVMERVMGENVKSLVAIKTQFAIGEMYFRAHEWDDAVSIFEQIKRENAGSNIEARADQAVRTIGELRKRAADTSGTLETRAAPRREVADRMARDSRTEVQVSPARDAGEMDAFIDFGYRLREREPNWVPPLRRDVRILLDRTKHPFHRHAEVEYFLARIDGRVAGRIAAIENRAHNEFHAERIGFFGFIEAENDQSVWDALFAAAEDWARRRGLAALRGPCSFSTNEECGLLVEGFYSDNAIMLPYHPPHYADRVAAAGYAKVKDLWSYRLTRATFTDRIPRLAALQRKRLARSGLDVVVRPMDKRHFERDIALVKSVYNRAWEKNWGFVPMTDDEFDFVAAEMKPIADPRLVWFAEVEGEPVAIVVCLKDYNTVLKFMDGSLGPKQILIALALQSQIKQMRLLMLGVLAEYRQKGLQILLYDAIAKSCLAQGITEGDLSWSLEDNHRINGDIEGMGGRLYKKFRIYEKALAP